MGCRYACVCGGGCWDCPSFEPESYVGEAEDLQDEMHGGYIANIDEEAEHYNAMEYQKYCECMSKNSERR